LVIIAEDDIVFSNDAGAFLNSAEWLPTRLDLIKAETNLSRVQMSRKPLSRHQGHDVRGLKSNHSGSAGYFISREGARRLLAFTEAHCEPADRILFHPSLVTGHRLRVGQVEPALCMQDFHLAPETQREAVNTIGFIPRLATKRAVRVRRPLFARLSGEIQRTARRVRNALEFSVSRTVEMIR
jgi:glycosyl transferase, family 25